MRPDDMQLSRNNKISAIFEDLLSSIPYVAVKKGGRKQASDMPIVVTNQLDGGECM